MWKIVRFRSKTHDVGGTVRVSEIGRIRLRDLMRGKGRRPKGNGGGEGRQRLRASDLTGAQSHKAAGEGLRVYEGRGCGGRTKAKVGAQIKVRQGVWKVYEANSRTSVRANLQGRDWGVGFSFSLSTCRQFGRLVAVCNRWVCLGCYF